MGQQIIWGVLNWGLGHATRSTALIRRALKEGFEVTLASDGEALDWLRREFPRLPYLRLPSYHIRYRYPRWPLWNYGRLLPGIYRAARQEQALLRRYLHHHPASCVISDNRLGFHHSAVPSLYLSHQLQVPFGKWSTPASWAHRHFYRHFQQVLVPDAQALQLSGKMGQALDSRQRLAYTGILSHLSSLEESSLVPDPPAVLILLSGPEPQRSIWEQQLSRQVRDIHEKVIVVGARTPHLWPDQVHTHPVLNSAALSQLIKAAPVVVSRSGYSSLMDYALLAKKALLIPTPGQGEQEYLARHVSNRGWYAVMRQQELDLPKGLEEALNKPGIAPEELPEEVSFTSLVAGW